MSCELCVFGGENFSVGELRWHRSRVLASTYWLEAAWSSREISNLGHTWESPGGEFAKYTCLSHTKSKGSSISDIYCPFTCIDFLMGTSVMEWLATCSRLLLVSFQSNGTVCRVEVALRFYLGWPSWLLSKEGHICPSLEFNVLIHKMR